MITAEQKSLTVGIGELIISGNSEDVLTCIGIGSCIALCVFDPEARLAGMAHMLLPIYRNQKDEMMPPVKYINTGVPELLRRMLKQGASKNNLIVKVAGGARMLAVPGNSQLDIGQKNIAEIRAALARENLPICGEDLGGNYGRTIHLLAQNGKVIVRSLNGRTTEI